MEFTDEEIMQYVDGDVDQYVEEKISQARKSDASLEERIYKFQLANTVMLKHVQENKSMPDEFYNELRDMRIAKESGRSTGRNVLPFRKLIKNVSGLAVAASVAFFAFFTTSQYQIASSQNLARDFYASFESLDVLEDNTEQLRIANVDSYLMARLKLNKKSLEQNSKDVKVVLEPKKLSKSLEIEVRLGKDNSYSLTNGDFVSLGSKLLLYVTSKKKGFVTLTYFDSANEKQVILDRKPISKEETKALGPYSVVGPIGSDYIQYIFDTEETIDGKDVIKVESEIVNFKVISHENNFFTSAYREFSAKPLSLFSNKVNIQLGERVFEQSMLKLTSFGGKKISVSSSADKSAIWRKDGRFFIDVTDDGFANIVTYNNMNENSSWYISIDRNSNRVLDGVGIITLNKDKSYNFSWLLDENEDGVPDTVAMDKDGDWEIDTTHALYPAGSSFKF